MRRHVCICIGAVALCALLAPGAQAAQRAMTGATSDNAISTSAAPTRLPPGHATTISGTLTRSGGPTAGRLVELQLDPVPYGRFINAAHTVTAADGAYTFAAVRVSRDTRFRVAVVGAVELFGPTVEVLLEPAAYPSSLRVRAAARYIARRRGTDAFAVLADDNSLAGVDVHRRFHSASVVKSMLLVAYLRMLARHHRSLDRADRALLYPMIHSSDNEAASAVLAIVGQAALNRVATDAHMADYQSGGAFWGFTEISAADLARFFFHQQALIPRQFDRYARRLLSSIEPSESWGIPAVARPEFQVFFKGGWLPDFEDLVNQAARLERPGIVFALAVLTIDNPSMAYGEETIEGVTARLLGRAR
jgi:hypothetical protein